MVVGITFNQIIIRLANERARERFENGIRTHLTTLRFQSVFDGSGTRTGNGGLVHNLNDTEMAVTRREKKDDQSS